MMTGGVFIFLITAYAAYGSITMMDLSGDSMVAQPEDECKGKSGLICTGCSEAKICVPGKESIKITCSGRAPYCQRESGSCGIQPDLEWCKKKDPSFACLRDGQFPDPKDCTKFHTCADGVASTYTCLWHGYDPAAQQCTNCDCDEPPIRCSEHPNGVKVPFEKNSMFFTVCSDGSPIATDKCDDGYVLNATSQACEMKKCPSDW